MVQKPVMDIYRTRIFENKKELFFDNRRGSFLLFEARVGTLRTRLYRSKCEVTDATCSVCGYDSETMSHLVM